MSDNIVFDNIIITDDKQVSEQWAAETFDLKRNLADKDQVRFFGPQRSGSYFYDRKSLVMKLSIHQFQL